MVLGGVLVGENNFLNAVNGVLIVENELLLARMAWEAARNFVLIAENVDPVEETRDLIDDNGFLFAENRVLNVARTVDRRRLQWPPFMKRVLTLLLLAAACSAPPTPAPTPAPEPMPAVSQPATPAPANETPIGTGRVNASLLNVRSEPSMNGEVVGHARRGEKVTILAESGEWLRVRTGGGEVGWVSSQHVARSDASSASSAPTRTRRGGCPPDSDYRFLTAPRPAFNEGGPHGVVTIEASVNAQGTVTSTKVVSNTTGEETLAALAAREIREAKFAPPVRNCVTRAFIFTYRRAF